MRPKKPIYMYQCVVCDKNILTEDTTLFHCGKLTQWVNGNDGRGIDMDSPMIKVHISGYVEISQENLERILSYDDPHTGLVYSLHMGYVKTDNLEFTPEEGE